MNPATVRANNTEISRMRVPTFMRRRSEANGSIDASMNPSEVLLRKHGAPDRRRPGVQWRADLVDSLQEANAEQITVNRYEISGC